MIVRLTVGLLLSLFMLAGSTAAFAQGTAEEQALAEAKRHFEAGKNAYTTDNYQAAIREFKAAEALRPSPMLAYNIGLANEKLGKRRVAVKYYRRYLEGAPGAPNRAEVEGRITTLERDIAANPNAPANNQPQQVERPSDMPPEQPPPGYTGAPAAQPGYDPYQQQPGQPQPGQPVTAKKKQNLWWVWMIVGIGSAALLAGIIAAAVIVTRANNAVYYGYVEQAGTVGAGGRSFMPAQSGPAATHRAPDTVNLTVRF
jgi:tetratricopeptide (TPR) repeat protein